MKRGLFSLVLAGALTSAGCVTYVPVDVSAVPPEEEVRVRVRDDAAVRMASRFGRIRQELMASVEPRGPDSLAVVVWLGKEYPGTPFEDVRETVILSRNEVHELRRRELSVWRTAFASAGAVVVFAWLVDRIFLQENPNRRPDGELPPPPESLSPTFVRSTGGGLP